MCSQWKQLLITNKEDDEPKSAGLTYLVDFYTQHADIDRLQRHVSHYAHILNQHTNENDALNISIQNLVKHLQDSHWAWTKKLYSQTIEIYTQQGEVLPFTKRLQQRNVFYGFVEHDSQNIPFAYIWLDAFRYEMIHDLKVGLQALFPSIRLSTRPILSELPSNTEVGMNLMGPMVNDSDMLIPVLSRPSANQNANNITGFKIQLCCTLVLKYI